MIVPSVTFERIAASVTTAMGGVSNKIKSNFALALSIMTNKEPKYKEEPDRWLDKPYRIISPLLSFLYKVERKWWRIKSKLFKGEGIFPSEKGE